MDELRDAVARIEILHYRWSVLFYQTRGKRFRVAVHKYREAGQPKTGPVFVEFGEDILELSLRAAEVVEKLEAENGHKAQQS